MLGKYERLDVLGHGASGIVYLAKDTLLGKQVALKEIATEGGEKERFLEEARVLDRLHHPNIVQVNTVNEIDDKVVIDMEYIRGRNLQDVLRQTPQLPVSEALGIAVQICDGLAYAHGMRTVHRDVKPANIILAREGLVKLVDFGLAEVLGTQSFAGGAGTYAYMAPEDFHESEQSDRQSDIWAVGIILYEMLAGQRPFRVAKAKDPFAWKRAVETESIVPLTQFRSDVPEGIDAIIEHALARDKHDRYLDAGDMASDLRALGVPLAMPSFIEPARPAPESVSSPINAPLDYDANGTVDRTVFASVALPDFPPISDIDQFLTVAPDHWVAARTALIGGALSRWLRSISEEPLAAVAHELMGQRNRDEDERLRDFLYRSGLEITQEARRAADAGGRLLKAGNYEEAATVLRRAANLDPATAQYSQSLAQALRAKGDQAAAALVLEEAIKRHPTQRALAKEHSEIAGSVTVLSTDRVNFGTLRQGDSRSANILVRNQGRGTIQGRVASSPGWIKIEPASWTNRQRQKLSLTAQTENVWRTPETYTEKIVLETSGGRREIAVSVTVLPARRTFFQVLHWYVPLLFCALLPEFAGFFAQRIGVGGGVRHLWEPGAVLSGLLCGALFALAVAADTIWTVRLFPLILMLLNGVGVAALMHDLSDPVGQSARIALVQTTPPVLVMLVMQGVALARDPNGWGRWQLWRWIVAATGLLITYALLQAK